MVGTFALVFAGCGAIMVDELSGGRITHLGIGLVFGLVIMVMWPPRPHTTGCDEAARRPGESRLYAAEM